VSPGAPALLAVEDLACGYAAGTVASGVSFAVERAQVVCLLGPNGVGKTTLFKAILRLLPLGAGRVRLNGEDVSAWPRRRFAEAVAYVPQAHAPPFPFTVRDVVVMGRIARIGPFASPGARDLAVAERVLDTLGVARLADCAYTELSGGERQLTLIARALAQEPQLLVMDEPTANLDFGNQLRVLEHVRHLARELGLGVLMTTHDPNHALVYADKAAAMGRGGSFAVGEPARVITREYLRATYGVSARMIRLEAGDGGEVSACLPTAWGEPGRRPTADGAGRV
jgi:iron complex transport system ATP-binding protein